MRTRTLGRTGRTVSVLGLGGQGGIQWPAPGADPAAIVEKAVRLGVNYLDTSNLYGQSQLAFGEAFRRLGVRPGSPRYDPALRASLFVATKTHFRTARSPEGGYRTDRSDGQQDGSGVRSAVDDVRRSLSQMFGDGRGGYPPDAYLDCVQLHNLNAKHEVDVAFLGLQDPRPGAPWMGALPALLDLREGTDRTGLNPRRERLVRHIGITGHWDPSVHVHAVQRDSWRILDTLLVALNPNDASYFPHQTNSVPVAAAAGMGVIAMKVFADGAFADKPPRFSDGHEDVWTGVGIPGMSVGEMIRYPLSVPGVSAAIVGIGHVDPDPRRCQLMMDLAAAQLPPLDPAAMRSVEARVSSLRHEANRYFQRPALGLTPPRRAGAEMELDDSGEWTAVRLDWDTAYAGPRSVVHYDVERDGQVIGRVPHRPQASSSGFTFTDPDGRPESAYRVISVDSSGFRTPSVPFQPSS